MTDEQRKRVAGELLRDAVPIADLAWRELSDVVGKETLEMAEPRDLFQMGFNSGVGAALAAMKNPIEDIGKGLKAAGTGMRQTKDNDE